MKDLGQLLVFVGKAGNVGRQVELDDQPFAGFDGGVLCFVKTVGGDAHDIKGLHLIGDTFDKMHGAQIPPSHYPTSRRISRPAQ